MLPEISSQVEIRVRKDNSSGADDRQHVDWMKSEMGKKKKISFTAFLSAFMIILSFPSFEPFYLLLP